MGFGRLDGEWTRIAVLGAALAVVALAGCNDQPAHCTSLPQAEFAFQVDPAVDEQIHTVTATVRDIQITDGTPPAYEYDLRTPLEQRVRLVFPELEYALPIKVDSTYTFTYQIRGGVPAPYGLKILDDKGLRFLGVTDWLPSEPRIFPDGYGDLGSDGALRVFFGSAGCDPREENSRCFLEVRNYRTQFSLGDRNLFLWNREQGQIGSWIFHVLKSVRVQVKAECVPDELQNQISFFVVREDALLPG
jgi:hypothetical protein